jgi:hypothetical protein
MLLHELTGPDWTAVNWILLSAFTPGFPTSIFDNLVFQVPLPGTLLLVLLALGILGWRSSVKPS